MSQWCICSALWCHIREVFFCRHRHTYLSMGGIRGTILLLPLTVSTGDILFRTVDVCVKQNTAEQLQVHFGKWSRKILVLVFVLSRIHECGRTGFPHRPVILCLISTQRLRYRKPGEASLERMVTKEMRTKKIWWKIFKENSSAF